MHLAQKQFMEVTLGPFKDAAEACDYCFSSYTKEGQPPAGPEYNMFCAPPASAAGFVASKGGC